MRLWRMMAVVSVSAVLAACVTPARIAGSPDSAEQFSRVGRFGLTVTESDGRQHATQGGFAWLDEGQRYALDLTNPLGSIEARVEGQPGSAVLTRANGSTLQATDPDALAEEALGSRVPVAGLRNWFKGRVATQPPAENVQTDAQGKVQAFVQGGWRAVLSRYDDKGPQLLVLERQEPGRRIVLRLIVNNPS